jgi:hypothetical protein
LLLTFYRVFDVVAGEAGEALTVIDKTEAWMFHVLGDDTGASAVWVAQRVPDDHVSGVYCVFVVFSVGCAYLWMCSVGSSVVCSICCVWYIVEVVGTV